MPVYSTYLTIPPTATELNPAVKTITVLGNFITHVEFIFRPGNNEVSKVALFYGIKKLYPEDPDQWFFGNAETFKFDVLDPLPEDITRLRLVGWNDGGRYEHTIGFRLVTKWEWELRERIWLEGLIKRLDLLLRRIGVI